MRRVRTHHNHPQGRIFSWMVLMIGFGIGLVLPIFPNFVKSILHTDSAVSLFYAGMAFLMFIGALGSTLIFKKVERATITKISLSIVAVVFFLLIFVTRLTELAILNAFRIWFNLFMLMALSLFVRDFAKDQDLGEEEGIFYKFQNIGFFAGPLLGGFLASWLGYEIVFILTTIVLVLALSYFYHQHIVQKHPAIINKRKTSPYKLLQNVKTFFKDIDRTKAYLMTLIAMLFVSFKRLYIPLYVVMSGYVESMTGIILALGIIPYILLEVKVGKYADKKGIRLPASIGFLIIALALAAIFISPYPLLNFSLLVLINIGSSLIEPLQEFYLFKHLPKEEEEDLYGIYMTADPIAYFLAPAIGAITLIFLPFNYVFLVFGVLILTASAFSWLKLKHS